MEFLATIIGSVIHPLEWLIKSYYPSSVLPRESHGHFMDTHIPGTIQHTCMYMHVHVCMHIHFLQDEIISKLKERLLVKHSLAYEPLLDLLVQFARDVQSEFYPYFKEMFPILVGMCDCQDADLIQVY